MKIFSLIGGPNGAGILGAAIIGPGDNDFFLFHEHPQVPCAFAGNFAMLYHRSDNTYFFLFRTGFFFYCQFLWPSFYKLSTN